MTNERSEVVISPDIERLSHAAAEYWIERAGKAITERGRFTVTVSGGSSPQTLYRLLASDEYRDRIDWANTHVFWGDDRFVPPDHRDSNYRLVNDLLLSHVPIPAAQVHRIPTEASDPDASARAYENDIRTFFGLASGQVPRFDLQLLGMGSDGHTESLFPGFPTLKETVRLVVGTPPGELPPPVDRVTLTLPVLNASRAIMFVVTGQDKSEVLQRVLDGDERYPAALVKPTDGDLKWFVDAPAMGEPAG